MGEDGGDGRSAGAAVGAALVETSGDAGVGGSKRGKGGEAMLAGCQGGSTRGVSERGGLCDVGGDTGGGREGRGRGIGRSTGTDPGGFGSVALEDF